MQAIPRILNNFSMSKEVKLNNLTTKQQMMPNSEYKLHLVLIIDR